MPLTCVGVCNCFGRRFFVDIVRTKDWRYITVNINSKTTSEIFLIDPLDATMKMKKIVSKKVGSEFFIDHSQVCYKLRLQIACFLSTALTGKLKL
jgi:protease II